MCVSRDTLTLEFSVRGRNLVIKDASTNDCLVSRGLASDLAGTTLRILPLPGT